ncbi:hypothetical protein ASC86_07045 [Rhizobium sp. Root1212]|nr:hypothetical protein ASC86_07045 [Rhizobium sp. Root1212]
MVSLASEQHMKASIAKAAAFMGQFRRGGAWGFHREAGGHQLDTEQKRKKLPDAYIRSAWGFHREAGGHQLDTEQKRKKLPDAYIRSY